LTLFVLDTGTAVWGIAFGQNPFIPIMVRSGCFFSFYSFQPGVFPGRLVKMAVNTYIAAGFRVGCHKRDDGRGMRDIGRWTREE
jgi:hypothetical protein